MQYTIIQKKLVECTVVKKITVFLVTNPSKATLRPPLYRNHKTKHIHMNEWKVTGILIKDAVIVENDGDRTVNFNAVNIDKPRDNKGNYTRPIKTYIDCQWIQPKLELLPQLKKGALIFMQGKPYSRPFKRSSDDSEGVAQAMTVTEVIFKRQIGPDSNADDRSLTEDQATG